jgi:LCP family protein required for cell wall assembly
MRRKVDIKKVLIVVGSILSAVLLVLSGILFFIHYNLSQIKDVEPNYMVELSEEPEDTDVASLPSLEDKDLEGMKVPDSVNVLPEGVYNIMLFGLDTRDGDSFNGRSDVMLLITLDTKSKKIKTTSFMRDILVPIPSHNYNRLNTAYGFEGPATACEVISKQFGIFVQNYVAVNFWSMASIIDLFGGIDIEITSKELKPLNENIKDIKKVDHSLDVSTVKHYGKQHLNGTQAVAYMRIRHAAGADFERTQRQRNVMMTMMDKLSGMSVDQMLQLLQSMPQFMRTNLSQSDLISFAYAVYELRHASIEQLRLPIDGSYKGMKYKGTMSVLKVDFEENAQALKDFLNITG